MAKSRLTKVAEGIGGAIGRADRTAHKVAKAGVVAKKELEELSKEVDSLKKRLQKATKRLQKALR
jgi:prefoldin subunit 5